MYLIDHTSKKRVDYFCFLALTIDQFPPSHSHGKVSENAQIVEALTPILTDIYYIVLDPHISPPYAY